MPTSTLPVPSNKKEMTPSLTILMAYRDHYGLSIPELRELGAFPDWVPGFTHSAHRRLQEKGWLRQIECACFAITSEGLRVLAMADENSRERARIMEDYENLRILGLIN